MTDIKDLARKTKMPKYMCDTQGGVEALERFLAAYTEGRSRIVLACFVTR